MTCTTSCTTNPSGSGSSTRSSPGSTPTGADARRTRAPAATSSADSVSCRLDQGRRLLPAGRAQHQVDVVGLALGERRQARQPRIVVLGEAKSASRPRMVLDVERLDRIRALLVARGVGAESARLAVFGRSGFDADLRRLARKRDDIVLVDLERLYQAA